MKTNPNDPIQGNEAFNGLTKREYFAALALQGILADPNRFENSRKIPFDQFAVRMADNLISELNKNN